MIEQTQFLSTVFLCSEFKLEYAYSGAGCPVPIFPIRITPKKITPL